MTGAAVTLRPEPLLRLLAPLGVTRDEIASEERPSRLTLVRQVHPASLQALTPSLLRAALEAYGQTDSTHHLKVRIHRDVLGDMRLAFDAQTDDLDQLTEALSGNLVNPTIELDLDTGRIATTLAPPAATGMLFGDTAARLLSAPPAVVESRLWDDPFTPATLLIGDTDALLQGPLLAVVGGRQIDEGLQGHQETTPSSGLDGGIIDRLREYRPELVPWDHQVVTAITPAHFLIRHVAGGADLLGHLGRATTEVTLAFLADRVTRDNDAAIAWFDRGPNPVRIRVPRSLTVPLGADAMALWRLVVWCYSPGGDQPRADVEARLLLARESVTARIWSVDDVGNERARAFAAAGGDVLASSMHRWRGHLQQGFREQLSNELELLERSESAVTALEGEAARLVQEVTDAAKAAVGTVVGTFIAAALAPEFRILAFRIAVTVYAVWLAVFPGLVGLLSIHRRAGRAMSDYAASAKRYSILLGKEQFERVEGDRVNSASSMVRRNVVIAAVGYGVVFGLALLAAANAEAIAGIAPQTMEAPPAGSEG